MPEARKNEAKELFLQALDWHKQIQKEKKQETAGKEYKDVVIKDLTENLFPPCIKLILQGLKDGKKRALFILMNFFKSLGIEQAEIEKRVEEWNKKNKPQLREGYIKAQFSWQARQKKMLPPNCDKDYYKGIGVCMPDELCSKIKNPVNYVTRKARRNS
jgi:DNA primase large subunit